MKLQRPKEPLKATVTKIPTGLGTLYITINEIDNQPFEVFLTIGTSGTSIMAKAEAIGRLISLSLRYGVPITDIVEQLIGIGDDAPMPYKDGVILSIPDAVGKVLKERYLDEKDISFKHSHIKKDVTIIDKEK